jgi:ribonuclease-3
MYLDGGLGAARSFVLTQARDQLATLHEQPPLEINPKGALQEILQALPPRENSLAPRNPVYTIVSQAGPDHAKSFVAQVDWYGLPLGRGRGASKQQAESAAALDALRNKSWDPAQTAVAAE